MAHEFVVRWAEAELERIMTATVGGAMTVDEQACCEVLAAAVAHLTTCDAARDQDDDPRDDEIARLKAENGRLRREQGAMSHES